MITADSGFAPAKWQSGVGSVLLFRDGGLPLSTSDVYALVDFFSELLDEFGEG